MTLCEQHEKVWNWIICSEQTTRENKKTSDFFKWRVKRTLDTKQRKHISTNSAQIANVKHIFVSKWIRN